MPGIKSSYEVAMEKIQRMGLDDAQNLSCEQKEKIAEIRSEFDAKIAERKILLKNAPELPGEIGFLERERDRRIKAVYSNTPEE
jgi:hypothetical protein